MARVLDYRSWTEYNRYSKETTWKGFAKVDPLYDKTEDLEEAVKNCYTLHSKRVAKVVEKLNLSSTLDIPRNIIWELQEWLAGDLREVYGKRRNDAFDLYQPKRLDMIKIAEKIGVSPGSSGWEQKVISAIEEGES